MAGWTSRGKNNPLRFLASVMLAFMIVAAVVASMADSGLMMDIWLQILSVIPFGDFAAKLAVGIFSEAADMAVNASDYLLGGSTTFHWFMENLCKLCLSALLFEALANFFRVIMGIEKKGGIWVMLQKLVADMVAAVLAAFAAGLVLAFLFDQLNHMTGAVSTVIPIVVTAAATVGCVVVSHLLLSIGLGLAIAYVVGKVVLMNIIKLMATYVMILFALLCMINQTYFPAGVGLGAWGVIIIMLIGLEMLFESIF